jgi:hypothetical protein
LLAIQQAKTPPLLLLLPRSLLLCLQQLQNMRVGLRQQLLQAHQAAAQRPAAQAMCLQEQIQKLHL